MTRTALFLAGTAVLSFASPAAAQSMDHSSMPGMTMPVEPKKPVAETVPVPQPQSEPAPMPEMDHGNMPGLEMNQADTRPPACAPEHAAMGRSEEHTSELQSLMRNSYAVFCLKKKNT